MKKFLAITLSLIFVLTMATVSFADDGSITSADVYEWAVGMEYSNWPSANVIVHAHYQTDGYAMMKDKVNAGSVSVTLDGAATSAEPGDWRGAVTAEHGFYFKADIESVKDGETVTGATVKSAYLLTLHNETHVVTLYSVANGTETKLVEKDIDGVVEGLIDAEPITGAFNVGRVTLKADFTADGKVAIYAGAGNEASTKVIDYTPDAAAPAGDDVVLMGRSIGNWDGAETTSPACFDAYSAEEVPPAAPESYKPGDSVEIDVNATYVEGAKNDTYLVDIAWGAMEFNFIAGQKWDAVNHEWVTLENGGEWEVAEEGGNVITVTNHSSKGVSVALSYAEANSSGVIAGEFVNGSFELASAAETGEATEGTATFMPTTALTETAENVEDYVLIGKITVTIGEVVAGA